MFELGITTEQVIGYLLVFARVGAWVWLTPPFGGPFLPPQVRVLTGLAFAIPMTPGAIAASGGISLDRAGSSGSGWVWPDLAGFGRIWSDQIGSG